MLTAGSHFTHLIRAYKVSGHELVKTGVYSVSRHPSYTAYFYWALSMQLLLGNWICFMGYFIALQWFFKHRIEEEEVELTLMNRKHCWSFFLIIKTIKRQQLLGFHLCKKKNKFYTFELAFYMAQTPLLV